MKKFIALFLFAFLLWLALTWDFDPVSLAIGLLITSGIAWALKGVELDEAPLLLLPHRLLWAAAYIPMLSWYIIRANLDVAYRVLHPALPIRPGIVRARTKLRSPSGRVLLANSITLTPGTLTVDLVDDILYIHCICVPEVNEDVEIERSIDKFETFIRRIFE